MKISIQAMLNFGSKGADKVKELTERIKENLAAAQISAGKIDKTLGRPDMNSGPGEGKTYRGQRGVTGTRGAAGRNFSGMAGMANNETGGFVAAYATIAANLFAVTAAFQALSKAAQTEQLAKGIDLMGARAGVALPPVAKNLQAITDNALSYAESMKVVAQATAAGFKTTEVERLAAVARGASVALGRDMSDAMDRLTRGTIKLEPELLDELGIMTRLDEAVRIYAQANDRTVASLTNTERRQAFLNAVLAEGERKFGDVADQISSNPYDKLAASMRDLGTAFLRNLNTSFAPVAELLSEMPGLAIAPLIGIMMQAASKVLPSLGNSFQKVSDKIQVLTDKAAFSTATVSNLNDELNSDRAEIASGAKYDNAFYGIPSNLLDRRDVSDGIAVPKEAKEQILRIDQQINRLQKEDAELNKLQIRDLRAVKNELRESLTINKAISQEEKIQARYALEIRTQKAMAHRLESVSVDLTRGNILSSFGTLLGGLGEDIQGVTTKAGRANGAFHRLGQSVITTARGFGAIFSSLSMWITGAVIGVQLIISILDSLGTEQEKAYKKAKKDLTEIADRAKETRRQIAMMMEVGSGQSGMAVDAMRSSLNEIEQKLKQILVLKRAAEASKTTSSVGSGATRGVNIRSTTGAGLDAQTEFRTYLMGWRNLSKEEAKITLESVATLELVNTKLAEQLRLKILSAKTGEDVLDITARFLDANNQVVATYKDLNESARQFNINLQKSMPKEFETSFTKTHESLKELFKGVEQLNKIKLENLSKESKGIAESFSAISSTDITQIKNLAEIADPGYAESIQGKALEAIIKAKTEIEDKEVELSRIKGLIANQDNMALRMAELIAKAEKDRLETVYGQLLVMEGQVLLNASAMWENAKRQLEISKKDLEVNKQIATSKEAILKFEQQITKARKDAALMSALGGVGSKLSSGESSAKARIDSLIAARNNLQTYQTTLGYKKEEISLNATIARQSAQERLAAAKARANALTPGERMESIVQAKEIYENQIRGIDEIEAAQTASLTKEGEFLKANLSAERQMLASMQNGNLAREYSLELDSKALEAKKEQLALQKSISVLELEAAQTGARQNTFRSGVSVSPLQENKFAQEQHLNTLKNLDLDRDMLITEHNAKLALLDFENDIAILELQMLKKNNPEFSSDIDGFISRRKNLQETLVTQQTEGLALATLQNSLQRKAVENQLAFLQEFPPALLAVQNLRIALANSVDSLKGESYKGLMPGQARGYLDQAASEAGGYQALVDSGKAEEAKALAMELARVDVVTQGLTETFASLQSGISEAFAGIITGSKSVKQAFGDLALGVLNSIAKMIAEMITFKLLSLALGIPMGPLGGLPTTGANHAAAGGVMPLAMGGVMNRAAGGVQGVVKQPTYLVGEGKYNEAVVPLPNGRAIPVQMHGSSSANNNVQVNVNISDSGGVQTETKGQDGANLGSLIAGAVQRELMAQKMPGGILSKYGAS